MSVERIVSERTYAAVIPATPPYIPGRNNPAVVIALPTHAKVRVVLKTSGSSATAVGVDELVREYFNNFMRGLYRKLEVSASVSAQLIECVGCGPAFEYVALTNAVLEVMGGQLSEDVLEAATTLDAEIGIGYGVRAVRLSPVKKAPYVWRFGEGAVEAGSSQRVKPKLLRTARVPHDAECPLPNLLTHAAGMLAVNFFDALKSGARVRELAPLVRLSNSLWHAIYGVPAVTECSAGLMLITESLSPYVELYLLEDAGSHEGR